MSMVFGRLRRIRLLAVLVGLSLLGSTALPAALHGEGDDPFCARPLATAQGDASLAAASVGPEAAHCDVCHWLRSLRTIEVQDRATLLGPAASAVSSAETPEAPAHTAPRPIFARGPPS
jgi:hypothetical protein